MSKSNLRTAILVLGGFTAVVHVIISFAFGDFTPLFLLNGLGYAVLVWAVLWPPSFLANMASLVNWAAVLYTIVTIVLFFVFNAETGFGPMGLVTKAVEVLLVVALIMYRGK